MKTLQKLVLGIAVLGATSLLAADGAALYKKCAGCHGANGEKAALGKSQIIKGWDAQKTVDSLQGYKDGTYGGAMKGVMKGQVASMSDEDIKAVAEYIASK
jgi:cytochrome c553